jgi:hypothetical protein
MQQELFNPRDQHMTPLNVRIMSQNDKWPSPFDVYRSKAWLWHCNQLVLEHDDVQQG